MTRSSTVGVAALAWLVGACSTGPSGLAPTTAEPPIPAAPAPGPVPVTAPASRPAPQPAAAPGARPEEGEPPAPAPSGPVGTIWVLSSEYTGRPVRFRGETKQIPAAFEQVASGRYEAEVQRVDGSWDTVPFDVAIDPQANRTMVFVEP